MLVTLRGYQCQQALLGPGESHVEQVHLVEHAQLLLLEQLGRAGIAQPLAFAHQGHGQFGHRLLRVYPEPFAMVARRCHVGIGHDDHRELQALGTVYGHDQNGLAVLWRCRATFTTSPLEMFQETADVLAVLRGPGMYLVQQGQ
jgi:hypothetical protein